MLLHNCHQVLLVLIMSIVSRYPLLVAGQDDDESKLYPVDEDKFNMFKEDVCKHIPMFGDKDEFNLTWTDDMEPEEIYELAFLNMGYGLTADAVAHLPVDLGWRKIITDQIAYVARTTCDTPAISSLFLTATKNLFQYYMIKYEKTLMQGTDETMKAKWKAEKYEEQWTEIINAISKCAAEVEPIKFIDECGVVQSYIDSKGMSQDSSPVFEVYDEEVTPESSLDYIVDGVWWMFSTTYARCYTYFYPNEAIILQFLQRFREDVMTFFLDRWGGAGDLGPQFDIIFGPITASIELENLRKCTTAAYGFEDLEERQLVRPTYVNVDGVVMRNMKQTE